MRRAGAAREAARARRREVLDGEPEEVGQGAVVYFVDDPLYRAFWYEGRLLFGNAVFMPLR